MTAPVNAPAQQARPAFPGLPAERVEDAALLSGRGGYIDDLPVKRGTLHAALLRSSEAHAKLLKLDVSKARALKGVAAVLTGDDIAKISNPLMVGIKLPMECWPMARDRVRYVGEPVALVLAASRYIAEDAIDLIETEYEPLTPVVTAEHALDPSRPPLHEAVGSNMVNERKFSYGDPEAAFAAAAHRVDITIQYPRNAVTPIECYGVVATYDPHEGIFDVMANFQGPFSIHAVLARALNVPGSKLRLRTPPDSGGSFGVKQSVFPYIVLMALAARVTGVPVKWVEDRLEHLTASVSATNRVTTLKAAVEPDGRITALDWDQIEDVGAYVRAPEPATLYRMHGNMTGAYAIRHMAIRNRLIVTNKVPTGLNRGFGGPQVYFALERLVAKIAHTLRLDPIEVIRKNLIPADAFPYRTASGALYDSGDYAGALDLAISKGDYAGLLARRDQMRAEGRLYGIGVTAVVEPSVSNMGYITTVMSPQEREKAGPKNGAQATATIGLDPLGGVSVHVASVPQGQGHRTVLAHLVANEFGIKPSQVSVVTELDTARDAWSIASGNYSSRFAAAVAGAAKLAADRVRGRLAAIAAGQMNARPEDMVFAGGKVFQRDNPDNAMSFSRVAAVSHWAPGTVQEQNHVLRETVFWTPPQLVAPDADDQVNSSLCHGFIFDICGVEVDRITGNVRIDRYLSTHDCGTILHPGMVDGQIRGGFANAVGAALYEEYAHDDDGSYLTGTFADYLVPTVNEVPEIEILHMQTPSPFTPLGAKGVGEGNCMSTPVALANAVSDAIGQPVDFLPMTPARIYRMIAGEEQPRPASLGAVQVPVAPEGGRGLTGEGEVVISASREKLWDTLLDPDTLAHIVPGCRWVKRLSDTHFQADVTLGVGPVKGQYTVDVMLLDLVKPESVTLSGSAKGALGSGQGRGHVRLIEVSPTETRMSYQYTAAVGGKVASIGGRLLDGAARVIIGQFFKALGQHAGGGGGHDDGGGLLARVKRLLRRGGQ